MTATTRGGEDPPNRLVRISSGRGGAVFACRIERDQPFEFHPVEFAGWREIVLRDLDGPLETDVPDVYHLLARARGFGFALEKLKSLKTDDPVMKRVIQRAIEKQRSPE